MDDEWIKSLDDLTGRELEVGERFFLRTPEGSDMVIVTVPGTGGSTAKTQVVKNVTPVAPHGALKLSGGGRLSGSYGSGGYGRDGFGGNPRFRPSGLEDARPVAETPTGDSLNPDSGEYRVEMGEPQASVTRRMPADTGSLEVQGGAAEMEVQRRPTGKETRREIQLRKVAVYLPFALTIVDQVLEATENQNVNDPDKMAALETLKEFRDLVSQIIADAEAGKSLTRWRAPFKAATKKVGEKLGDLSSTFFSLACFGGLLWGLDQAGLPVHPVLEDALRTAIEAPEAPKESAE